MSHARAPMMALEDALARLQDAGSAQAISDLEVVDTSDSLGRVLAAGIVSTVDVPPLDNSAMDGYAVRMADVTAPGTVLAVTQRIAAGSVGTELGEGQAARIFTGAPVPAGADAIVMQEDTSPVDGDAGAIRIDAVPRAGQWIRRRGEDMHTGRVVVPAGMRMTPATMGLAAGAGSRSLAVLRRPRVAVFSTGDELSMPGEPLKPGGIYNSNRFTLRGLLEQAGCQVQDLGIVPDRLDATRAALREAAATADLIVTSGGVSVGEEDHLRPALQAEGELDLWNVAMKPGKPLALGRVRRGVEGQGEALYVGLPGNPVSSWVTTMLCVYPLLRALQRMPERALQPVMVPAAFERPKPDGRREFLRARIDEKGRAVVFTNQSSGVLTSAAWADGLVDIPAGQTVSRGDLVAYLPLASMLP